MPEKKALLLIGRWGNGKTSVGNTIVGRSYFDVESSDEAHVNRRSKMCELKDNVFVVDGLSIYDGDTIFTPRIMDDINFAVMCNSFISGLVLVLKYGVRYTKQEQEAIDLVRHIFGKDSLQKWGMLVFTYGDNFLLQNNSYDYFEIWIKQQQGAIAELLKEVDYRCVLFDNKASSEIIDKQNKTFFNNLSKLKITNTFNERNFMSNIVTSFNSRLKKVQDLTASKSSNNKVPIIVLNEICQLEIDLRRFIDLCKTNSPEENQYGIPNYTLHLEELLDEVRILRDKYQ